MIIYERAFWQNGESTQFGGFTDSEVKFINKFKNGYVLHLFSGGSDIGDVRVDIWPESNATDKVKVLEYLAGCDDESFDTVIADPPYNKRYDKKYGSDFCVGGDTKNTSLLKSEMKRVLKGNGIILFKHWFDFSPNCDRSNNYTFMGAHFTTYGGFTRVTILSCWKKQPTLECFL